jgi:cell division protein FtsL
MEYIEPLITADKILDLFDPESRVSISQSDIYRSIGKKGDTNTFQALKRLKEDGYLDFCNDYFSFNGKTLAFIGSGKYKGLCEREQIRISNLSAKEKLEEESIKSVIATNEAVQENFTSQKITTYISIGVGVLSLIFIGISTYYQANDKTPKEVQKLKEEVIETQKKLQNLQSSLKEINSSIQKPKTDTVFLKQK